MGIILSQYKESYTPISITQIYIYIYSIHGCHWALYGFCFDQKNRQPQMIRMICVMFFFIRLLVVWVRLSCLLSPPSRWFWLIWNISVPATCACARRDVASPPFFCNPKKGDKTGIFDSNTSLFFWSSNCRGPFYPIVGLFSNSICVKKLFFSLQVLRVLRQVFFLLPPRKLTSQCQITIFLVGYYTVHLQMFVFPLSC